MDYQISFLVYFSILFEVGLTSAAGIELDTQRLLKIRINTCTFVIAPAKYYFKSVELIIVNLFNVLKYYTRANSPLVVISGFFNSNDLVSQLSY
jgi:hypothetical protein